MKKLTLIAVFSIAANFIANAQSPRIGFTAGTALANYQTKYESIKVSSDTKLGITAGILMDVPIADNFSFQPGINFVQKGTKYEYSDMGYTEKGETSVNCLELPLNFLFNHTGNTGTFFIGAGPSFAIGLSGKDKYDDGTDSYNEKIHFGNNPDNDDIKRLDIGANLLTGYRFPNGLFISVGYNAGLSNVMPGNSSEDGTLKSHYLGIKLGFLLNEKK